MRILLLDAELSALPGLVLSTSARAREHSLRDADGRAECEPVRRCQFLFEELRCIGPYRGGDPRQQSLAAGRVGARARDGDWASGTAWRYRAQGGSSVAAARRDAV